MKTLPIVLALLMAALNSTAYSQSADPLTFSVAPGEVTEASVALTADGASLRMNFTSEKRIEFADFTQRNLGKKVKIIVADKIVAEPVIRAHMMGGSLDVIVASPEEGLAVAKILMAK